MAWVPVPPFDGEDLSTVEFMVDLSYDVSGLSKLRTPNAWQTIKAELVRFYFQETLRLGL